MGLCQEKPIPKWPNTLKNQHYQISSIEVNIPESHPDIVFQNNHSNHIIFIDCKSKTLKREQIKKYDEIRKNPKPAISSGKISVVHSDHLNIDPALCSFSDLSNENLIVEFDMVFLRMLESGKPFSEIREIQLKRGKFRYLKLNEAFPIDTSTSVPPYYLYPFDEHDIEIFTIEILKHLQKYGLFGKRFTVDDILERSHKMWKFIDDKSTFRKKAHSILVELQNKGLRKYLRKEEELWHVDLKLDGKSHQAFQKKCIQIERQLSRKSYQDILAV
ncbi:hypothetical protein [Methanoregula sp.]|jgi:hypothetical protein|uniref:hypothetical protein n=1 Tax=Methanoregula sp. TaxID=2052170 RepID=UPI003D099E5B